MNDDDAKGCRDVDIFTQAAMADRGIDIPTAFVCEVRRYDGVAMDIHVKTHADLATFLDALNAERVLVFRGDGEEREDFNRAMAMADVTQHCATLH